MPTLSGSNNVNVTISTTADTSGVEQTERAINGLDETQNSNAKSTINWGGEFQKASGIMAGLDATIGIVTKSALEQAGSYQQNRIAFETMLGSAEKAKTLLVQISDFAAKTPFTLPQVQEGAKFLLAFGFSQDEVIDKFKMLGNIAAAVGTEKLPNLVNVFGQVKAAGRLMSQDLLQFTSAGVPIIDELAKHFGIAKDQVRDLVEKGKVSFDDLNASMMDLGGPAGKWGDLMAKQSLTFNGTLSNVQDNLGRVLRQAVGIGPDGDIRKGSLFDIATKAATAFMNSISKLQPYLDKVISFFEHNKDAVAALGGAIVGLVAGPLVALAVAIGWIPLAIVAAVAVFGAFTAVMITNFGRITSAVDAFYNKLKENSVVIVITQFFQQVFVPALKAIWAALVQNLMPAIEQVMGAFVRLWNALQPGLVDVLKVVGVILGGVLFLAIWLVVSALNIIIQAFSMMVSAITIAIGWIANLIGWFGNLVGATWNAVSTVISIFRNLWPAFRDVVGVIGAIIGGVGGLILSPFQWAYNAVVGLFRNLPHELGSIISGAFSGVTNAAKSALHGLHIPGFATGVTNFSGGLAVVGEQGPELVNLPAGSDVYTNKQSQGMMGGGQTTYNIQSVNLTTADATNAFFAIQDRNGQLASMGMSVRRAY